MYIVYMSTNIGVGHQIHAADASDVSDLSDVSNGSDGRMSSAERPRLINGFVNR